jgi:cobalt/nickel transport system ATP-binding protein
VTILEFDSVTYAYPTCNLTLDRASFSIRKGSKVALVGPNGAGKTTLLLMCNGILRPDKGEIRFHGSPLAYGSAGLREVRKRIGLVFQNSDSQLFAPTVYQDVAFGPVNLGMDRGRVQQCVESCLHAVGLDGYERRPPHQLSGGEKKRVAIAGILAMGPELLVFDEPTSSLDPAGAADLMELLDELNADGKTVIISTHDVELAYSWADDVILMAGGRVIHQGRPAELFTNTGLVRSASLRVPAVLEIYAELQARGLLGSGEAPASVLHLVSTLAQALNAGRHPSEHGRIVVCDIDRVPPAEIQNWIQSNPAGWIGAMGTRAKSLAGLEGIEPDFTHGVIDKSILRALAGDSTCILTIPGMVQRIRDRVLEFEEESGMAVEVARLGGDPW